MTSLSRENIDLYRDFAYAHISPRQTLDIYVAQDAATPRPVLVHIHGGAWAYGDKQAVEDHGLFYARHGFVVVCINYRLSTAATPEVKHPDHVEDCAAALAWVHENIAQYHGDPSRIYLSGHSSGAHLAALLACDGRYLQKHGLSPANLAGVVGVDSAAYNLGVFMLYPDKQLEQFPYFLEIKHKVIEVFGTSRKALHAASPVEYVSGETCPRFLVIVCSDRRLARDVSRNFVQLLQEGGKEATLLEVGGYGHEQINIAMHEEGDPVAEAILGFLQGDSNNPST